MITINQDTIETVAFRNARLAEAKQKRERNISKAREDSARVIQGSMTQEIFYDKYGYLPKAAIRGGARAWKRGKREAEIEKEMAARDNALDNGLEGEAVEFLKEVE